jgi:Ca-activated chloride channel family protein
MKALFKACLITVCASVSLFADGFVIFPELPYPTPLSVKYHRVTVTIDNNVAVTSIDQEFVNAMADELVGGEYIFPVPSGAVVDNFGVVVDGEALTATLMEREAANEYFQNVMKKSGQASMLQYASNSAYRLQLTGIAPGESRRIQLSYTEVLGSEDGLSKYLYPLNTEKFSYSLIEEVMVGVTIRNASAITSVYSPSHAVSIRREDRNTVVVSYEAAYARPSTDFELFYKVSQDEVSFHLFTYKETGEDGYFLMLITPQYITEEDKIVAKDIIFTIDKSGSMSGTKIVQARQGLSMCLDRLRPEDYFNIITFNDMVEQLAPEILPASPAELEKAQVFAGQIAANGSTNIEAALTTSLGMITSSSSPHYIIFLTDGLPTAGERITENLVSIISEANTSGTRIFSVGFGYDVNTILLDQISANSGAYSLYCDPDDNIEEVITSLYKRIESPVLTSPALTIGSIETFDVFPRTMPDLFSGSQVAVYGRYSGEGSSQVVITGKAGDEERVLEYEAYFPDRHTDYGFVPKLWATSKIAYLMSQIKISTEQARTDALIDTVKELSLAYGIVTPYTSAIFAPSGVDDSWGRALQEVSGVGANDASNYMNEMQQAPTADYAGVQDTAAINAQYAPQQNQMQNAGDKVFSYNNGVWQDVLYDSTKPADTVYYASEEYFDLVNSDPDLAKYLIVGNQVAINSGDKQYVVLYDSTKMAGETIPLAAREQPKLLPATQLREGFGLMERGDAVLFSLPRSSTPASVAIYSAEGRLVKVLTAGGRLSITWDRSGVSQGMYYAVYRNANVTETRKIATMK